MSSRPTDALPMPTPVNLTRQERESPTMAARLPSLDIAEALVAQAGEVDRSRALPLEEVELSIIMPCLNEERTLGACIETAQRALAELGIGGEVLVVDNGSTDNSVAIAERLGARVVRERRRGYGNALRRGFGEARGRYLIMGDCDESYDFKDIGRFVERLRAGADLVMGNRFRGQIKPGAMPWHHQWVGNPLLTGLLNILFRTGVGDAHCGLRGLTKEAYRRMNLEMPGMELASEMVIKSAVAGLRIEEIPITLWPDGRDRPPHLRSFRDGWRHLRYMLMCCPTFLFLVPGLLLSLLGVAAIPVALGAGYGSYTKLFGPNFMFTASLLATAGAHLMAFGFLARLHAHQVDPVFRDPRVEKLAGSFSVERGLLVGLGLITAGGLLGAPVLYHWLHHLVVPSPGQWILAGTLAALGIEAIFTSFLVGILDLPRETKRNG